LNTTAVEHGKMLEPGLMYGYETWSMTEEDKVLNIWERKTVKHVCGAVTYQGVWRMRLTKN
jgi:hypothetical protein